MKKILALAMVLSVIGSIAAGCGSKTDDSSATTTPAAGADTKAADTKTGE